MTTTKRSIEEKGGEKTTKLEICHPSVCVGGATPSNCVCPTTTKK